ncbi:MAG: heme ABC exporter ATP-binding protein CcmA [Anaerolineae bacterium]
MGADQPPLVVIEGLSKRFGPTWALRKVDLTLTAGAFLTIFGPNGAGKTTLIRILATLSRPSSGEIYLAGVPLRRAGPRLRRSIGLVTHQTLLYPDLSAEENLRFYGRLYDVPELDKHIDLALERVGLQARRYSLVHEFSRGMQQRLSIARAIIHDPALLLLDEPYTGLDPEAAETLGEILTSLSRQSRTIILATHNLERGLALCDEVAILARGRVAYRAPREEIDGGDFGAVYRHYVAQAA